jgi:hypothetical protein
MRKDIPSLIFIRTIDKFGELGVDTRKVETAPSYNRAPWTIHADKCLDFTMCSITKRERIVAECTEYNEWLKMSMDGSLKDKRVGYTIVEPETTIKSRMRNHYQSVTYLKAKELL